MIELVVFGEKLMAVEEHYVDNGRLAIAFVGESPAGMLTTNMPRVQLEEDEFCVKTWSENETLAKAAKESNFFVDTGKRFQSGYVQVEIWKLAPGVTL